MIVAVRGKGRRQPSRPPTSLGEVSRGIASGASGAQLRQFATRVRSPVKPGAGVAVVARVRPPTQPEVQAAAPMEERLRPVTTVRSAIVWAGPDGNRWRMT